MPELTTSNFLWLANNINDYSNRNFFNVIHVTFQMVKVYIKHTSMFYFFFSFISLSSKFMVSKQFCNKALMTLNISEGNWKSVLIDLHQNFADISTSISGKTPDIINILLLTIF